MDQSIFVVDPDPQMQDAVRRVGMAIDVGCHFYNTAREFLVAYDGAHQGCLVAELRLADMNGAALYGRLLQDGHWLPIIYVMAEADVPTAVSLMQQGAVTVLEKPCPKVELLEAIRLALDRDRMLRDSQLRIAQARCRIASLTNKERSVMELMIDGRANKAIATELDVSVRTVEARRQRVFKKTKTHSIAELVRLVVALPEEELSGRHRVAGERG